MAHEVYVSKWGEIRLLALPPYLLSSLNSLPRRKNGQVDMRYSISKSTISWLESYMKDRFEKRFA